MQIIGWLTEKQNAEHKVPLPPCVQNSFSSLFRFGCWIIEFNSEFSFFFIAKPIAVIFSVIVVFPIVSVIKSPPANARDVGLIPGLGRSPREGNGNPLQYSCLENPMDRGAWWATIHRVTKSWTWMSTIRIINLWNGKMTCQSHLSFTKNDYWWHFVPGLVPLWYMCIVIYLNYLNNSMISVLPFPRFTDRNAKAQRG